MKTFLCVFAALFLGARGAGAITLEISANSTVRAASPVQANYTTTHLYIDEVAGDSIPITIFFGELPGGVQTAEVFTNLNRRDRADDDADGDTIEDGIFPPSGHLIEATGPNADSHYYKAYTMTPVSGGYQLTLFAQKTGAYRITARYRLNVGDPWTYYTGAFGYLAFRAHAVVVSPKSARDIQLYEVNPLTIIATGTQPEMRGTFADLAGGVAGGPRFSLQYVKDLGCNMLWFQPIHPNGIDGRQIDPTISGGTTPFEVGSPYAVKNFFEIMPLMAKSFVPAASGNDRNDPTALRVSPGDPNYATSPRGKALMEFQSFAAAADAAGVGLMLDAPFNHTSFDCELAPLGQTYWGNGGTSAASEIRNVEARFYARSGAYDMRASGSGNIAIAPDRIAEFQFNDTFEVYFGRYAALVSGSSGPHTNENDWFDYSIGSENSAGSNNGHFDTITHNVWRYFGAYLDHWLTQTGYPANPTGASLNSDAGFDALRADFGQGLPPQCWEYLINRARTRKWNLIFMAESLDGGAVTYRSGRHFDILNENIVFPLHAATSVNAYRDIYENRRNAYGQALVLLNSSSHDEDHYQDPFHALIRYAVNSTIDGVPLIFPGQELGLSGAVVPPGDTQGGITPFGYDRYETNFGKPIPHFKKYNSLMPLWLKTQPGHGTFSYGLAQLSHVYSGIGQARKFSPALRSSNRFFLNLNDGSTHGQIFSVAKFEQRNGSPATSDVVFAFVNIDRNADPETTGGVQFNLNADADTNGTNDFGLKSGRRYNVRNISAYLGVDNTRRDTLLIPGGKTGAQLLSEGLYVKLNRVPTTDPGWATAPYEPQYLKLYDVTAPVLTPSQPAGPNAFPYEVGNSVTFTWPTVAPDSEGVVPSYRVNVSINGGAPTTFTTSAASYTASASAGQTVQITVQAINPNEPSQAGPASTASAAIRLLAAGGDEDADGMLNGSEKTAGTNPLDTASLFKVMQVTRPSANSVQLIWSSVAGVTYRVLSATDPSQTFLPIAGSETTATGTTASYTDANAGMGPKFYKVRVGP